MKGIDCRETYAPVIDRSSIRTVLPVAAVKGDLVKQIDFLTVFLNRVLPLDEQMYVKQLTGFEEKGLVCRLNQGLCRLNNPAKLLLPRRTIRQ